MRKIYFLIFVNLISLTAFAQIQNAGLEAWTTTGTYEQPDHFATPNPFVAPFGVSTVSKSTDSHQGSFAAQLETEYVAFAGQSVPGAITNGEIQLDANNYPQLVGGQPLADRPDSMTFFYKASPAAGDVAGGAAFLLKWDAANSERDTIGAAYWTTTASNSTYEQGTLAFTYFSADTPDTLLFVFASSLDAGTATAGSVLLVDEIAIHGLTMTLPSPALVSPADNAINIDNTSAVLDWNDVSTATGYEVQYSTDATFSTGTTTTSASTSTLTLNSLALNTTYFWRVRTTSPATSNWSNAWSFTTVEFPIGITEIGEGQVVVFPNPAADVVYVQTNHTGTILLYDLSGRQVAATKISDQLTTVNISRLSEGVYICKVTDEAGTVVATSKLEKL